LQQSHIEALADRAAAGLVPLGGQFSEDFASQDIWG
jgi:hypothetical protein